MSNKGNIYICVMYVYDFNGTLTAPIKTEVKRK